MKNKASVTEFILMRFTINNNTYILHSVLFSFIYLWALMESGLIIMIITLDHHLYTPMYFFLKSLSFLDLSLISITITESVVNSLAHNSSISFLGCETPVFLVMLLGTAELFLLTAMSFDHYIAICLPLHYEVIMNMGMCMQTMSVSWLGGVLTSVVHTAGIFSLSFCESNVIHQFFCDTPQLLAISCSVNLMREIVSILTGVVLECFCFIFITVSYIYIFSTVKKIPSTEGPSKAYSTCLPHLGVIVLFLSTACISYLKPTSRSSSITDSVISIFYTTVPPTLNPIIYTLRNKPMKVAVDMLTKEKLIKM